MGKPGMILIYLSISGLCSDFLIDGFICLFADGLFVMFFFCEGINQYHVFIYHIGFDLFLFIH